MLHEGEKKSGNFLPACLSGHADLHAPHPRAIAFSEKIHFLGKKTRVF